MSKPPKRSTHDAREKWGDALIDAGWAIMPSVLIRHFGPVTGHDSVDLHIIAFLIDCWWEPSKRPMPSKAAIAQAIRVDPQTVRRRIKAMQADGLIERVARRSATYKNTNVYLLDGLKQKLEPFAVELLHDRKTIKSMRALRAKQRSNPATAKLRIVRS
jgi:DNA-binding transcriptional regulator YhcF (GntR family)